MKITTQIDNIIFRKGNSVAKIQIFRYVWIEDANNNFLGCELSNKELSKVLDISERTIVRSINWLVQEKFLYRKQKSNSRILTTQKKML